MHPVDHRTLDKFARAEASPSEGVLVVRHLLSGCPDCKAHLAALLQPARVAPEAYSLPVARACRDAVRRMGKMEPPNALLAELDSHPPERRLLLCNCRRFASPRLAELLLDASDEARGADPMRMVERAMLAVRVCLHSGTPVDIKVRAWGTFGNAKRILGDHREAEKWLASACACAEACSDPRLKPRVLRYLANLRLDQRRFAECLELLGSVTCLWRDLGEPQEVAACLALSGAAHGDAGRPAEAITYLLEAASTVDATRDPRLNLVIVHNFARFQFDCGKLEDALGILARSGKLYLVSGDEMLRTKGIWLRGQILTALGRLSEALPLLAHTRATFSERGQVQYAALASLDLALALAQLGRIVEVRQVAQDALDLSEAAGFAGEALASLALVASVDSADQVVGRVVSARAALAALAMVRLALE